MKKAFYTLVAVALAVGLSGCGDDKKEAVKATVEQVKQETVQAVETVEKEVIEPVVQKVEETAQEVKAMADEQAKEMTQTVNESQQEAKNLMIKLDDTTKAARMFNKTCATCHGKNAEKKALNASAIIQGWDKERIAKALHGYKDNTYGGAMKAVMIGQAGALSDDDIKIISEYISGL